MPERIIQWQQYNQTIIHPATILLLLLCTAFLFTLPRRWALLPVLLSSLFVTEVQRLVVLGLDFNVMRIMTVLAWVRIAVRREAAGFRFTPVDKALLAWTVSDVFFHTLLIGTFGAFVNRLGWALNGFGLYLVFRCCVRTSEDMRAVLKAVVFLSLPIAGAMLIEQLWRRNLFSVFGGVPEVTVQRAGRLRAQAAFMHPILAGTFGASILPLCLYLYVSRRSTLLAVCGVAASTVITFSSSSSGPVLAYLAAWGALAFWPLRRHLGLVRWGALFTLLGLHLVMKAPVWALLNRVAVLGESTAYHRYLLVDSFIRHFGNWWLCGSTRAGTWGWGLQDITNHYVLQGLNGGLITLLCFIGVLVAGFRCAGRSLALWRGRPPQQKQAYLLGCALFVHAVSFFGVSYFDQIIVVWYLTLALVAAFYAESRRQAALRNTQKPAEEEEPILVAM